MGLRLDGLWIERQRALEQIYGVPEVFGRLGLRHYSTPAETVVERIGILCRSGGLRGDQFKIERESDPPRDIVLQCEQVAHVAVEPLGPEMRVGLSIDQLSVDADPAPRPPDATF